MFIGQTLACVVEIILCVSSSGYLSDGTYSSKPVCVETTGHRGFMCKILKIDESQLQVDCNKSMRLNKRSYDISNNKLNWVPKWVDHDKCNEEMGNIDDD